MVPRRPVGFAFYLLFPGLLAGGYPLHAQPGPDEYRHRQHAGQLKAAQDAGRRAAMTRAREKGWLVEGKSSSGARVQLQTLSPAGFPLYNESLTTNASLSINAQTVHSLAIPVIGEGIRVGVWDEGNVRTTHVEFNNGGIVRCFNGDTADPSNHSTAVAGVIIASGQNVEVVGAAPAAVAECRDWDGDLFELASRAPLNPGDYDDIPITNHSYGYLHGWARGAYADPNVSSWHWLGEGYEPDGSGNQEDPKFGNYTLHSALLDEISWNAPWQLIFWASGNDRDDIYGGARDGTGTFHYFDTDLDDWQPATWVSTTAPPDEKLVNSGYDTLITRAAAKNLIAVGAVNDAVNAGVRDPAAATMLGFSGWGPADDGRVKPDLVGNGYRLRVTIGTDDTSYGTGAASGTSFSSPNVAGAATLILSHARAHLAGWQPRASSVKALLIHGATDLGNPGPDYIFGWGLPDVALSIEPLQWLADPAKAGASSLVESRRTSGSTAPDDFVMTWDGTTDLVATLCWTDPPGTPGNYELDDRSPVLVHDLDLRITGPGGTFFPFRLDPENPADVAMTGDNIVDVVEQIIVPAGSTAGMYTVSVSHKGSLTVQNQWYSLVVTGQTPVSGDAVPLVVSSCSPDEAPPDTIVDLVITGDGFRPGMQASLAQAGVKRSEGKALPVEIPLTGLFGSPETLHGRVDLAGAQPGDYDLVVTRGAEEPVSLGAALRIVTNSRVGEWQDLNF